MERHSISKEEHWREGYGFDSVAKDVDHEEWEKNASELMPHDWAQFALLGERMIPLDDGKVDSEIKPPSAEALGHLEWRRPLRSASTCVMVLRKFPHNCRHISMGKL